jgi:hypothetical protein
MDAVVVGVRGCVAWRDLRPAWLLMAMLTLVLQAFTPAGATEAFDAVHDDARQFDVLAQLHAAVDRASAPLVISSSLSTLGITAWNLLDSGRVTVDAGVLWHGPDVDASWSDDGSSRLLLNDSLARRPTVRATTVLETTTRHAPRHRDAPPDPPPNPDR